MADNGDKFDMLQEQFGGKELIPNDVLYKFLLEIRQDLVNMVWAFSERSYRHEASQTDSHCMRQLFRTWLQQPEPVSREMLEVVE